MNALLIALRMNHESLVCGIAAAILVIAVLSVIDSSRWVMLVVSIPFMLSMVAITMGNARSMSRRWNSFIISSGVGRSDVVSSLFVPSSIVYLIIAAIMMAGSSLLSEDVGWAVLNCVPVACVIAFVAALCGIVSFSLSGSSLFSDILGAAVPILMIMIGYCCNGYEPTSDILGIVVLVVIVSIMVILGWKMSVSSFRRLDL